MEKRTFLKMSSAALAGAAIAPLIRCSPGERPHNWAGNLVYWTDQVHEPKAVEELQSLIKKLNHARALGTRHSFNTIADSTENLVSSKNFDQVINLDKDGRTVTVGAGIRYGQLAQYLETNGFALHNLASLPHISVAGACATGTHGSGVTNGNLSTAVLALEMVTASGEVVKLSRQKDGDQFLAAVVGLGALGIVTAMTLEVQPTYSVRQFVYLKLPMKQLGEHFDEILSSGYSVSLFTDWQSDSINQVWIKRRVDADVAMKVASEYHGAMLADRNVHPIIELSAENCTEQQGRPGPWHERLPHFKMGFTPSSGAELQAEYFVPRSKAFQAITAVQELRDDIKPVIQITEIRTIASDDLWMSPAYKQDSVAIHFTLKPDKDGVMKLLPKIEEKLAPFGVCPHWAKLFTLSQAKLKARYEKFEEFTQLMAKYDPTGKFRNEFITTNFFGS